MHYNIERSIFDVEPKGGTPTALAIEEDIKLINRLDKIRFKDDGAIEAKEYIV